MSNKSLIIFLIFLGGVLSACLPARQAFSYAEELKLEEGDTPVQLKADSLNFDGRAEMVRAEGNVIAVLEGVTIEADRILIDVRKSIATAEGNVHIERQDYALDGSRLTYLVTTEVAEISNFNTRFKPVQVKGELYIKVGHFKDTEDKKAGGEGSGTTCEYARPHYDVKAAEFEYFPKDKIVAKNVTFYIGPAPLIWMPVYIFDISRRRATLLFPILGENLVEGRFLKWSVDYFVRPGAWGTIYIDWMEKKGIGKGFAHNFDLGGHSGELFLYQIDEMDSGRLSGAFKFKDKFQLTPSLGVSLAYDIVDAYVVPAGRRDYTKLNLGFDYKEGSRKAGLKYDFAANRISALDNLDSYKIDFAYSEDKNKTAYTYNYKEKFGTAAYFDVGQRFSHTQYLTDKLNLKLDANYYRKLVSGTTDMDERLDPAIEMNYQDAFGTLALRYKWYADPDRDRYTGDNNLSYLESFPELELKFAQRELKILDCPIFNLNTTLGWAKYHEARYLPVFAAVRDFTAERARLEASISRTTPILEFQAPDTIINLKNKLYTTVGLEQYLYAPGDRLYVIREDYRLASDWFGFYRNNLAYMRSFSDGASPFFFDERGTRSKIVTDRMEFYCQEVLSLSLDGGYNYETNKFLDNNYNLKISPSRDVVFNFSTGYDIERHLYKDFVAAASIIPYLGSKLNLNANYNQNTGKMNSASSLVDLEFGRSWYTQWHLKMAHSYDTGRDQLRLRELTVTKDLHCWEASISYTESKDEKSIFFTIKAFPEQALGFISGSGGVFFEGFKGLRKESVTRY